jgi:hypothetical protein
MKPVCPTCKRFFEPKENGIFFEEGTTVTSREGWKQSAPYKLWAGDLWECKGCAAQVVLTRPDQLPIAEHYQPDYGAKVVAYKPRFRVH